MEVINITPNSDMKINTYPRILKDYTIVEYDGYQSRYGSSKVPNTFAFKKETNTVSIYHLNAIKSFTPLETNRIPIELIKTINTYV